MTQKEFEALTGQKVDATEYERINKIYNECMMTKQMSASAGNRNDTKKFLMIWYHASETTARTRRTSWTTNNACRTQ